MQALSRQEGLLHFSGGSTMQVHIKNGLSQASEYGFKRNQSSDPTLKRYNVIRYLYHLFTATLFSATLFFLGCTAKDKLTTPDDYLQRGDQYRTGNQQRQARRAYQELLEKFPESSQKAEAQFNIASSLYQEKNYLEARFEYQKFLELHPAHALASQAQYQIAMCDLQQVLHHDRDQLHTQEALTAFRKFRRTYPQDSLIPQAETHVQGLRQRLADHELSVARFYYRKGAYHAAIGRLLNLIQVYPTSPDLDSALFMLAKSYVAEENFTKAQRVFRTLVDRFPTSTYIARSRAQLRQLPSTGITLQQ